METSLTPDLQHSDPARDEPIGVDLAELETFVAVAKLGSFSLAAQQLHVTQPSVTGRVQRLEASLGTQLLIRTTRSVVPTPVGTALVEEATQALAGLRKLVSHARQQARLSRQRVVVAATPAIAAMTLPALIRDFMQRYTDVQIVLRDLRYVEALSAVEAGSADLAILAFEGNDKRFAVQPLCSQDVVLLVPNVHPLAASRSVTVAELAPFPLLLVSHYEPMRERIAAAAALSGVNLAPSTYVDNLNTLLGLIDAEWGAALLARQIAEQHRRDRLEIVELSDVKLSRDIGVVSSSKAELGTAAQSFVRFVREALA